MLVIPCHDQRESRAEASDSLDFNPSSTNTEEQTLMSSTSFTAFILCTRDQRTV